MSIVNPSSDSRLSEKFLAPSKTPDNTDLIEYGAGDKLDKSPWSFSGDSLLFQTPRPAAETSSFTKVGHRLGGTVTIALGPLNMNLRLWEGHPPQKKSIGLMHIFQIPKYRDIYKVTLFLAY